MKKDNLREKLLKKRDCIEPWKRQEKAAGIMKRLFSMPEFRSAKKILFYASFKSEVNTIPCLDAAIEAGKRVILPVVDKKQKRLKLVEIKDISELMPGYLGILEPSVPKSRERKLREIDLAILPGAGFDVNGNRIGYGAGYYDKLLGCEPYRISGLKKHIATIALAFEKQIVPRVPNEGHDVKIDKIVTETRVINCKRRVQGFEDSR
ncbi:MAG: 5-formyltetrahydrofolate cyclo-ligase [Nitrospirae bacterium]|nr:5-formyltetrahydrofolate cyclo-ligase [Nitrospirota bacterium]